MPRGVSQAIPEPKLLVSISMRRVHLPKLALAVAAIAASVLVPALANAEPGFSAVQPMPRPLGVAAPTASPYTAISCPTTSSCTAVASSSELAKLGGLTAVTETGSAWGTGTQLPLPANAHVSAQLGPYVEGISCSAVGTCTAVGDYPTGSYGQPLVETETSGVWAPTAVTLPTGGVAGIFTKLWCATQGSCIAVGYYIPPGSDTIDPMFDTETSGTWAAATAMTAPLDATFVLPEALGCTDVDDCVAVGEELTNTSVVTINWVETAGTWSNATRFSTISGSEFIADSVACPSSGTCLVGGALEGSRSIDPGVVTYSAGAWSLPQAIPEPQLSPAPRLGEFTDIACSGPTMCEAVGVFAGVTAEDPGAATWTSGTWSSVGLLHGLGVDGIPTRSGELVGVSCAAPTSCVAIGLDLVLRVTKGGIELLEDDFSAALTPVRPVTEPAAPVSVDPIPILHGVDAEWTPPTDDGGSPVVGYTATVTPGDRYCETSHQQCRISGLADGHRYEVTVRDVTSFGPSGPTTSASFVAGSAPQPPRNVRVAVRNNRIFVSWHRSTVPSPEHVTAYAVTAWRGHVLLDTCRTKQLKCSFREFRAGTYVLELTATDATGTSHPSMVHVRIP
jgi:hypothetical protein